MAAETVGIAASTAFGNEIPISVGVTVQNQVVGTVFQVETDGLAIVHGQLFVDVVTALIVKAFRLRMGGNGHLNAGHFKAFQMDPGTVHLKSMHPAVGGFDQ